MIDRKHEQKGFRGLPIFVGLSILLHLLLIFVLWLLAFPSVGPLSVGPLAGGGGGHGTVALEIVEERGDRGKQTALRARRSTAAGRDVGPGTGTGLGTGSGPAGNDPILAQIRDRIERAKRYPVLAKKFGLAGRSLVRFEIDEKGHAREVALKSSSGSNLLDDEALATIRRAAPFPTYPTPLEVWIRFDLSP